MFVLQFLVRTGSVKDSAQAMTDEELGAIERSPTDRKDSSRGASVTGERAHASLSGLGSNLRENARRPR